MPGVFPIWDAGSDQMPEQVCSEWDAGGCQYFVCVFVLQA